MQSVERKVLKDYSYNALQTQKAANLRLQRRLARRDDKLARRTTQLIDTVVASDLFIDKVCASTSELQKELSKDKNIKLPEIEAVTVNLNHHINEAIALLKDTGAYPIDELSNGEQASSDSSDDEEANHWKCEALNYDSDGRSIDFSYNSYDM